MRDGEADSLHTPSALRLQPSVLLACLISAVALGSAGCGRLGAAEGSPSASASAAVARNFSVTDDQRDRLEVVTLKESPFRRTVETTGTVQFNQNLSTQVVSAMSGTVTEILLPVGAQVTAGTPLAKVASPDYASDLSNFRKSSVVAGNLRRVAQTDKKLLEEGNIGRREMEQAEADALGAEADRDSALEQLRALGIPLKELGSIFAGSGSGDTLGLIRAPMDGTIVEQLISPGELLQNGSTPCFTIAKLNEMWVMASVFESDLPQVKVGEQVDIQGPVSQKPIVGRVDYVADLVDPSTRAVSVRVVTDNVDHLLKRNAYVNVAIHSSEESHALLVPPSAILLDSESLPFVFIENEDKSYSRRRVTSGARNGDQLEITEGLKAGDRVVSKGGLFLQFAEEQ